MAMIMQQSADILKKFQKHPQDTASPAVQIALMTARLEYLNQHFQSNKKDHHSRRGLMKIVGKRRRLLNYLQKKDAPAYGTLIAELGIRK